MKKHDAFAQRFLHRTGRLEYGLDFIKAMPDAWTDEQRWAQMVELYDEMKAEQYELRATILEYEHALQHAVDPHPVPGAPPHEACPDCQRLCQSALDGVNREGFREIAEDGG